MNIVFMGTPDIAAESLTVLLQNGHKITGVFTREDKPVGRKQVLTPPPVKVLAEANGIPVRQPKTMREEGVLAQLREMNPDLIVVVAYGRILPPEVLALPKYGCINLHVSLLPQYRGAAPVQWAVIHGEKETGVTIMQLDEGLDTGPILAQQPVQIGPDDTAGEVFERVAKIGARLLYDTVQAIQNKEATAHPQQGQPSLAPPLTKQMAQLDFALPAQSLHNLVRGCNPWPVAWFAFGDKRIKVKQTKLQDETGIPGTILRTNPLVVACGEGSLQLEHLVPQGSRPMTGAEWAAGQRFTAGMSLYSNLM